MGIVESIEPVDERGRPDDRPDRQRRHRGRAARGRRPSQPEARQDRRAAAAGLGVPGALPLELRPQVPGDRPRDGPGRAGGLRLRRRQRRARIPVSSAATCRPIPRRSPKRFPSRRRTAASPPQTEFDAIDNTFDTKTRKAGRQNLVGFGNAFAGRGDVAERRDRGRCNPLFENLGPVSKVLADPDTRLAPVLRRAGRHGARSSHRSPSSRPSSSRTRRSRSRRSRARPGGAPGDDLRGPADAARWRSTRCRGSVRSLPSWPSSRAACAPASQQLRLALPGLNSAMRRGHARTAQDAGARTATCGETLVRAAPARRPAARRSSRSSASSDTLDEAKPLLEWVVPAQTVCNYLNYWFTYFPAAFDRDEVGYNLRQIVTTVAARRARRSARPRCPAWSRHRLGGYSGFPANGIARAAATRRHGGSFEPDELPIAHGPFYLSGPAGPECPDCQAGQPGYLLGASPAVRAAGQASEIPAIDRLRHPRRLARADDAVLERGPVAAGSSTPELRAGSHDEGRSAASGFRTGRSA